MAVKREHPEHSAAEMIFGRCRSLSEFAGVNSQRTTVNWQLREAGGLRPTLGRNVPSRLSPDPPPPTSHSPTPSPRLPALRTSARVLGAPGVAPEAPLCLRLEHVRSSALARPGRKPIRTMMGGRMGRRTRAGEAR